MTREIDAPFTALVPMRHRSERVPGKNLRPLAGRPLYAHILASLLACPDIGRVAVDTDSPEIEAGVRQDFPAVRLIRRPEHLRGGEVPMNDVLLHDLTQLEGRFFLQTHATNPLLRPETITAAIRLFRQVHPQNDSLLGVTRLQTRLWDAEGRPLNHDPEVLLRTQDLPPLFEENSCIYLFERATLETRRNRLGLRPRLFEIGALEAWDIDEESDFRIAECLVKDREGA